MGKEDNEMILEMAKKNLKLAIDKEIVADVDYWAIIYTNSVYFKQNYKINGN